MDLRADRRGYLDACSDLTLVCNGGNVVTNRFTMLVSCGLVRDLHESFADRPSIPVDIPFENVQLAIDLIHGTREVKDILDLPSLKRAVDTLMFLDCDSYTTALSHAIWMILVESTEFNDLVEYSDYVLIKPYVVKSFYERARALKPHWNSFKRLFDNVRVTPAIAKVAIDALSVHFNPYLIFDHLIRKIPPSLRVSTNIAEIFSAYRCGAFFHPAEMAMCLDIAGKECDTADRNFLEMLSNVSQSLSKFDPVPVRPHVGTTIYLPNANLTSSLVSIEKSRGRSLIRCDTSRKLRFVLDRSTGVVTGKLSPLAFETAGEVFLKCTVISLADSVPVSAEIFRRFVIGELDTEPVDFVDGTFTIFPEEETEFRSIAVSPDLAFWRIDILKSS